MESITVITPNFNGSKFLPIALQSAYEQGDFLHKHIVIDGGSTDDSVAILERSSQLNLNLVWISEPDEGQSDALNKALSRVVTRYFCWLNADDRLLPGALRTLSSVVSERPNTAVAYGDYRNVDERGLILSLRPQPTFNSWDCIHGYLTVLNAAAVFKTDDVRAVGGFRRDLQFAMDYDLVLRLIGRGPFVHIRQYLADFRRHSQAKTSRMQATNARELYDLRRQYSAAKGWRLPLYERIAKARVAYRMTREGCIGARLDDAHWRQG